MFPMGTYSSVAFFGSDVITEKANDVVKIASALAKRRIFFIILNVSL